jgi:hypothetical protein
MVEATMPKMPMGARRMMAFTIFVMPISRSDRTFLIVSPA